MVDRCIFKNSCGLRGMVEPNGMDFKTLHKWQMPKLLSLASLWSAMKQHVLSGSLSLDTQTAERNM